MSKTGWDKLEDRVERGPVSTIVIGFVLFACLMVPVGLFAGGWNYLRQRYYETQMESARRYTYENNRSYVNGNIEELRRLKREYNRVDEGEKFILGESILDQFDSFDRSKLPEDLNSFLITLEN